jgi:hypothetical protein
MTASPRHPLDRSAAFTALLEFCPGFGKTEAREAERIVTRFLDSFYSSGSTDDAAVHQVDDLLRRLRGEHS